MKYELNSSTRLDLIKKNMISCNETLFEFKSTFRHETEKNVNYFAICQLQLEL